MDPLDEQLAQMLVATSDYGDDGLPKDLHQVLRALREQLGMDVVFVSQFTQGQRRFMAVDAAPGREVVGVGMSDPVEQSWCHWIVQGRLPELIHDGATYVQSGQAPHTPLEIGTHLSVPIVLDDGCVYGTLCTFAFNVKQDVDERQLQRLRNLARILARRLNK